MRRTVQTEWGELTISIPQDRAMRLARQIVRVLGRPAIDVLGAGVAVAAQIGDDWSELQTMVAIGVALTEAAGRERALELLDLVSGDQIAMLCASILDGCRLGEVPLVRQRPPAGWVPDAADAELERWHPLDSMAGAIPADATDGWALHMLALRVVREARLLPLPSGSSATAGEQDGEAASRSGQSGPSGGAPTRPS